MKTTFDFGHPDKSACIPKTARMTSAAPQHKSASKITFINAVSAVTRSKSFNFRNYSKVPFGNSTSLQQSYHEAAEGRTSSVPANPENCFMETFTGCPVQHAHRVRSGQREPKVRKVAQILKAIDLGKKEKVRREDAKRKNTTLDFIVDPLSECNQRAAVRRRKEKMVQSCVKL